MSTAVKENKKKKVVREKLGVKGAALSILMWIVIILFLAPFYVILIYAFKPKEATMLNHPLSFPTTFYWQNFTEAIDRAKLDIAFMNSLIATVGGVLLLVLICSMAAYIISRNSKKRFYAAWQYIFLASVMLPFQVIMFPLYKNLVDLRLLNNLYAYIIVMTGIQLSYNIFIYIGFVKTVPLELEEAAQIDGCGQYRTFFQIVFPLLKPITMTVIVLSALAIWNDYQVALVVVKKSKVMTLPIAQQQFITAQISYLNLASAACLISIAPVFIMFLFLQKYIAKGIVAGAVKG